MRSAVQQVAAIALLCAVGTGVYGQADNRGDGGTEVRRASLLLKARIMFSEETAQAQVVDFVLNDHGCIDFVVISYQEKYVLVPYSVVRADFSRQVIRLEITSTQLRQAPTFTQWSYVADQQFVGRVNQFFGVQGGRQQGRTSGAATGNNTSGSSNTGSATGNSNTGKSNTGKSNTSGKTGTQTPEQPKSNNSGAKDTPKQKDGSDNRQPSKSEQPKQKQNPQATPSERTTPPAATPRNTTPQRETPAPKKGKDE